VQELRARREGSQTLRVSLLCGTVSHVGAFSNEGVKRRASESGNAVGPESLCKVLSENDLTDPWVVSKKAASVSERR
jgi:hypothetical protein